MSGGPDTVGSKRLLAGAIARLASPELKIAIMTTGTRLLFERRLHVQTEGWIELEELGLPSANRVHYQPSPWMTLPRILRRSEVTEKDVFLDLGCGMGRMVLEAALWYPLQRVIGVEISPHLACIARANVDRNTRRVRANQVEILVGDVLDFQMPDDVTIVFLYNPFLGPIFSHVVQELLTSVDRAPRRVRIIYQNPTEEDALLSTGRIRRIGSGRSFLRRGAEQAGLALYEVAPADR